jgi:hypothetical protein
MLIYLATYPRSGNSLLQQLLTVNFRYIASQVKVELVGSWGASEKWNVTEASSPPLDWEGNAVWNDGTCIYKRYAPSQIKTSYDRAKWFRMLKPLPLSFFTEDIRQSLASEPNVFFVKLHDLPFDRYFDGEKIIQLYRNPGATLWSYFDYTSRLLSKLYEHHSFPPPTLDNIVLGRVQFGHWTQYFQAWNRFAEENWMLRMAYEEVIRDPQAAIEKIAAHAGTPIESYELPDFSTYQARFPQRGLRGISSGYESFFGRKQLQMLWQEHGELASRFGYTPPEMELACPEEQIIRLNEIIRVVWKRRGASTSSLQKPPASEQQST